MMPIFAHSITIPMTDLVSLARHRRWPADGVGLGYIVHAHLCESHGRAAPKPFRVLDDEGDPFVRVVGHSSDRTLGGVDGCKLDIPPAGAVVRFSFLACPVVRLASDRPEGRKGAEVDVYERDSWTHDGLDRADVYTRWATALLLASGASEVLECFASGVGLVRVMRRTQGRDRRPVTMMRPSVTIAGTLRVGDDSEFARRIRDGVGRHKSFGFGLVSVGSA